MELFENVEPGNAPEFSVSEISGAIKRVVEGEFSHVRVRGEVGRVSRPRSGHVYLDLKDDRCVLSAVIWKGAAAKLDTFPEEGLEVVATGRLTTFGGQSKYQMVIDDIAPAGMGALMAMLEKRKQALAAEGLFAEDRKRPLPFLPEVIGVVTSPSGAVIRDILHRLRDRFPRKVLIWPVAVQGKACAPEVARAIDGFNRLQPGGAIPRPDLLIVARGGGSIEDLWGFNEEIVVRAVAASRIPLISAVGHETDTTLIDHVSDRRAPTPTAAAELAVPVRSELMGWCADMGARLTWSEGQGIEKRRQRLRDLSRVLPRPQALVEGPRQRFDMLADRLPGALRGLVQARRVHLSDCAGTLRPPMLRRQIGEARRSLGTCGIRLAPALARGVAVQRDRFEARAVRLKGQVLRRDVARLREAFDREARKLSLCAARDVAARRERLDALVRMLETLSYERTLDRGYAVVRDADGKVLPRRAQAEGATLLEIQFADGRISAVPGETPKPAPKPRKKDAPPDQGTLF